MSDAYQEKRISLKLSRLCLTINNDRVWLLRNIGGNSFKIHAGFFKISDYHTSGRFKPSAKLMIRKILPVGVILVVFSFILLKTGERYIQLEAHCAMQR